MNEFIIYAMHQQAGTDSMAIFIVTNKLMSVFHVCPVIDNEFGDNIVKVVCGSTRLSPRGPEATLTAML